MEVSLDVLVLGTLTGLSYAMMAMGLVLVYRAQRFINFAQGQLGTVAVALLAKMVIDFGLPYWLAFVVALTVSAALGGLVELGVIRRLSNAPRLVLMVATIGLAQLFLAITQTVALRPDPLKLFDEGYPTPDFGLSLHIGSLLLHDSDFFVIFTVPIAAVALAWFLRATPYGQAIRAAAENPDAARLATISVKRMSTLVWVLAGLLSGIAAVLLAPRGAFFTVGVLGPSVLVRALGAALMGRMANLGVTFVSAVAIGIIESVAMANFGSGARTELVIFFVVITTLLIRGRSLARISRDTAASVGFGAEPRPIPTEVAALPQVRLLRNGAVVAATVLVALVPTIPFLGLNTQSKAFIFTLVCGYAIVGLSLCLLTGWAGQVSLGQFALVGVGAFAAARMQASGIPLPLVVPIVGAIGAAVAVAIGIPAVRIQGLFLAASTLAFAVLCSGWAFQEPFLVVNPSGANVLRPELLRGERAMFYFAFALTVVAAVAVHNFRNSGPGRLVVAVRENDRAAKSFGISATGARLIAFALAGFLASVAGVVFAYAQQRFNATSFPAASSLTMLSMVIVGGLGSIPGAILGAVFLFGSPAVLPRTPAVDLMVSGVGLLIFLMYLPGGMISAVYAVRDAVIARILRKHRGLPPLPRIVPPLRELWRVSIGGADPATAASTATGAAGTTRPSHDLALERRLPVDT